MSAANLLVGSTCGSLYIVRCDPVDCSATLKTTIRAGKEPITTCIDVANRSFYCLDRRTGGVEGQLLILGPTEFGSIEQKATIGTGAAHPTCMITVGRCIYICHKSGYSIFSYPKAPKSTRRRRKSTLPPVAEDSVAETLNDLYAISKTMGAEKAVKVPDNTLELMQQQLDSSTQMDVVEMFQHVKTNQAIMRFCKRQDERFIYGITKSGISSFLVMVDGSLIQKHEVDLEGLVDCDSDGQDCFALCTEYLIKISLVEAGTLEVSRKIPLRFDNGTAVRISKIYDRAYITTGKTVVSINLKTEESETLTIAADHLTISNDEMFLYVSNATNDKIEVYTNRGRRLGSCDATSPAGIVHMS